MSPDGRRLYTIGGWSALQAYAVDGDKVEPVGKSPRLVSGRFTGICLSQDGEFICVPTGGGNAPAGKFGPAPYSTLIFRTSDVTTPILQIKSGAYPNAVGFDMKSGLLYTQNHNDQLIVFNDGGIKLKTFSVDKSGAGRWDIIQFLVHPEGRKLVVLAENSGVIGAKAIAVTLPVP